jgi:hypothetical protein
MLRSPLARALLCLAVVCVPYVWLTRKLWFVCDDAFISFRYARNFANGDGLRFNLGDHVPVEGYSNLLWVLIASVFEATGLDTPLWMPRISFLCGLVLVIYMLWVARTYWGASPVIATLTTLLLSCSAAFCMWATGGLATMPLALLIFALFERLIFSRSPRALWHAIIIGILLTLLRTEGVGWALVIGIIAAVARPDPPAPRAQPLWRFFAFVLGTLGLVLMWRYMTYGALIANTAATKVHAGADFWLRGVKYVLSFWLTMPVPGLCLLAAPFAIREHGRAGLAVALMAVALPCYSIVVGGDFMAMGRFLVPGLPFAALLLGSLLQAGWRRGWAVRSGVLVAASVAILVQILPILTSLPMSLNPEGARYEAPGGIHLVSKKTRRKLQFRYHSYASDFHLWRTMKRRPGEWRETGEMMLRAVGPDASVVRQSVGAFGYYSNLFIYDKFGLVSRSPPVASAEDDGLAHPIAPGHDRYAPLQSFTALAPTVLAHRHLKGVGKVRKVRKMTREWGLRPDKQSDYAPVLHIEPYSNPKRIPEVMLLSHRVDSEEEFRQRWATYQKNLDGLVAMQKARAASRRAAP